VPAWEVLFFPEDFKEGNTFEDIEAWRLSDAELERHAKLVSKWRAQVR
jgi:hypothetical protein